MIKTAYSYVRFSSKKQQFGRSQARQIEACELYCTTHGLHLAPGDDYRFLDAGVSGWKGDHLGDKGQLARFISLVEDGTIKAGSVLIVESLDRLSREQVHTALQGFLALLGKEIEIVTLIDQRVYRKNGSPLDLIMSIFAMSLAHDESANKSKRLRDVFAKKQQLARSENKPMGELMPRWLELSADKKEYVLVPERANIVRRIFQLAIDGYGETASTRILNQEGILSFRGNVWAKSSVNQLLNNRAVLGEYQPFSVQVDGTGIKKENGPPIVGYFPAVVDESTFYQAQAASNGRRITKSTKQSKAFNVWQGVAKCSLCGSAMHVINKGQPYNYTYLQCHFNRKAMCSNKVVRLDSLEPVFRHMLSVLDSKSLIHDDSAKIAAEITVAEARTDEQGNLLAKYLALFTVSPTDSVNGLIRRTEGEIAQLKTQREQLQSALASEGAMSKKDFLEKLDLVSYEGRSRANSLLKKLGVLAYMNKAYTTVIQRAEGAFEEDVQEGIITLSNTLDKVVLQRYAEYNCPGHAFTAETASMILRMEQDFPVLLERADDEPPVLIPDPDFYLSILAEHAAGIDHANQ